MESMFSDARIAIRSLLKRPGFLAVTVFTFAIGIGANTAIYSVVHGVILAPLGFDDEDRLVAVSSVNPVEGLELGGNFLPDFWFWRKNTQAFAEMAFHGWRSWTLQEPDRADAPLDRGLDVRDLIDGSETVPRGRRSLDDGISSDPCPPTF